MACCFSSSPLFHPPLLRHRHRQPKPSFRCSSASFSDPFVLEIAEKLEDSLSQPLPSLQTLRDLSSQSLLSKPWPTAKDEPFRFTDTSFLKNSQIVPANPPNPCQALLPSSPLLLTILNGHVIPSLSRLAALPAGAFAGSIRDLPPDHKAAALLNDRFVDGDLFFDLNGVGAADVAVVYIPAGVRVFDEPLHLRFCYDEGSEVGEGRLPVSNPRVLVVAEKGAELAIVEEHLGVNGSEERCYWANSVVEVVVEESARVSHTYVQRQSPNSAHIKWTFTRQAWYFKSASFLSPETFSFRLNAYLIGSPGNCGPGHAEHAPVKLDTIELHNMFGHRVAEASSNYELIEISTGGRLSRHNLHIQQLGPDTVTELSAFHVAQANQIQDIHSKLVLDHPRGYSRQLHKCIVSHSSGHAVFDGNIKVNRLAQQTDAGQLTRSLLLAPRATVNVKPNLQIVADDVKCSHGAAVSDLEEDQLFYFQARGIDLQAARDALVFSFGAEVFERIPFEPFRKSVSSQVKEVLAAR